MPRRLPLRRDSPNLTDVAQELLTVKIDGLDDFRRSLRAADRKLSTVFDRELRKAADPIRDAARVGYYRHYRRRSGRSIQGIKSATRRGSVALTLGDARRPWLLGQEHGSDQYPQFGPHRAEGLFFWPAYYAGVETIEERVADAMDSAVKGLQDRVQAGAL